MKLPVRKKLRLENYDYSSDGFYFVTICTDRKKCIFGYPGRLNRFGKIAESELINIPDHYKGIKIDKYVVMPNHIHAIIVLGCDPDINSGNIPSLDTVVGSYKSGVSRKIHLLDPQIKVWQKSFNDHVIRNDTDYNGIWTYIDVNPMQWEKDEHYEGS